MVGAHEVKVDDVSLAEVVPAVGHQVVLDQALFDIDALLGGKFLGDDGVADSDVVLAESDGLSEFGDEGSLVLDGLEVIQSLLLVSIYEGFH
eukprot:CAMPEP_0170491082 /NCGR_PEP_ID=MMETSP0208-20121228/10348_1 /TAXON_ID=197538 /ORGANISM="Strombidium inclinatum, Strain S3" /LENGTH=91 /DNA_ID=CAMNT_0010766591 /DNA_START=78 /DNA_END=350 /DNA_ORIENTATION=+